MHDTRAPHPVIFPFVCGVIAEATRHQQAPTDSQGAVTHHTICTETGLSQVVCQAKPKEVLRLPTRMTCMQSKERFHMQMITCLPRHLYIALRLSHSCIDY